jgi:hypothetical protein
MFVLSDAAQTALGTSHTPVFLAQICDTAGNVQATLDILSGSVTEDETAATRRTCTLTLATTTLVPAQIGDYLHPLSGYELRLYRGVQLPAGLEYAPLGVFRTSKPTIADSGQQLLVTVTGNDRSSEITRRAWTSPYTAAGGQTVPAAIQAILDSKWTGSPLQYNLYPSTVTVAAGTVLGVQFTSTGTQAESGSTSGGNDPWADCVTLAQSAGCELFFDRQGVVIMRPVPQPGTITPVTVNFTEGSNCTMTALQRVIDETEFANEVIFIGTGATVTNGDGSTSPGAPVVGTASSTDPLLGPNGPLGARPVFITDPNIATTGDANTAAAAKLPLVMVGLDETALTAVDHPGLDAGDTIPVVRQRMKVNANYIVSAVTHPLDVTSTMSVTNRAFSVPA